MMYSTPVLDRRPRPPGTVPHRNIYNANANIDSPTSSSTSHPSETPLYRQSCTRKPQSSPAAVDNKEVIGLGLSSSLASERSSIITKSAVEITQPSPPPPYGPVPFSTLEPVSTPPTQDIDDDPIDSLPPAEVDEDAEEEQRRERAMDLAKSLGLASFSPYKLSTDENMEDGMNMEEIKQQLRQMKRRLKVRDHGMLTCLDLDAWDELMSRIGHGCPSCRLCVETA